MTFELTDDERDLLRDCAPLLGFIVAHPAGGIDHLRTSRAGGCGGGFRYDVGPREITGSWGGTPDDPERTASILLTRLRRWSESLPEELRARARVAWAVHPINTRDLAELDRIVREAVELGAVQQLDLFGAAS